MSGIYWLGLHKTGTTFLQAALDAAAPALAEAGFTYLDLDTFRTRHTRPLFQGKGIRAPSIYETAARPLVFDENIPALVQHALGRDALYPEGHWRADEMADDLGLSAPTLVMGVRNFATFLPSLYCEALKSTPFRPFSQFFRTDPNALSWTELARRLLSTFPESPLWIYRQEDLKGQEQRLLAEITGLAPEAFRLPDRAVRPGFSQAAIDAMVKHAAKAPISRDDVRALVAAHPRGPDAPGFAPFAEEEAALTARYASDFEDLARLPRVRVLRLID